MSTKEKSQDRIEWKETLGEEKMTDDMLNVNSKDWDNISSRLARIMAEATKKMILGTDKDYCLTKLSKEVFDEFKGKEREVVMIMMTRSRIELVLDEMVDNPLIKALKTITDLKEHSKNVDDMI